MEFEDVFAGLIDIPTMDPLVVRVENGSVVGNANWLGAPVRVRLMDVAGALALEGDADCGALTPSDFIFLEGYDPAYVDEELLDEVETAGWFKKLGKKVAKGFKKAVVKTITVAHKITHNKAFEAVHKAIQNIVPAPFKAFVDVHNNIAGKTHKFIERLDKGDSGAKALKTAIKASADGKLSVENLAKAAEIAKVPPEEAKAMAATVKLAKQAQAGDAKAQATARVVAMLNKAKAGQPKEALQFVTEAQFRRANPGARAFNTKGKSGHKYRVLVTPA